MTPNETLAHGLRLAGCAIATPVSDHVRILDDGIAARITPIEGGLSFRATVCGDDMTLDPDRINAANLAVRFARYSTDRGRLVIACEMLGAEDHHLLGHLKLWSLVVDNARRLVAELVRTPPITDQRG